MDWSLIFQVLGESFDSQQMAESGLLQFWYKITSELTTLTVIGHMQGSPKNGETSSKRHYNLTVILWTPISCEKDTSWLMVVYCHHFHWLLISAQLKGRWWKYVVSLGNLKTLSLLENSTEWCFTFIIYKLIYITR